MIDVFIKVKCVDNSGMSSKLTIGRIYTTIKANDSCYLIQTDDRGVKGNFGSFRFEVYKCPIREFIKENIFKLEFEGDGDDCWYAESPDGWYNISKQEHCKPAFRSKFCHSEYPSYELDCRADSLERAIELCQNHLIDSVVKRYFTKEK